MAKRSDEIDLVYTIRGRDDGSLRRVTQRAQADVTAAQRQAERAAIGLGGSRGGTLSASRGGLQMERDQLAAELRQQRRFQQTARAANQSAAVAAATASGGGGRVLGGVAGAAVLSRAGRLAGLGRVAGPGGGALAIAQAAGRTSNFLLDRSELGAYQANENLAEGLRPIVEGGNSLLGGLPGAIARVNPLSDTISRLTGKLTSSEQAAAAADEAATERRIAARQRRIDNPGLSREQIEANRQSRIFQDLQDRRDREDAIRRAAAADADAREQDRRDAQRNLQDAVNERAAINRSASESLLTITASQSSSKLGAAAAASTQYRQLIEQGVSPAIAQQLAAAAFGQATGGVSAPALATASSLGAGNVGARSSGLGGGDTTVKRSLDDSLKELKEQTRLLKDLATKGGASVTVIESLGVGF